MLNIFLKEVSGSDIKRIEIKVAYKITKILKNYLLEKLILEHKSLESEKATLEIKDPKSGILKKIRKMLVTNKPCIS